MMKNTWKIPGALFLLMTLAEIIAVSLGYENIHFYLKPFLMPVLAVTAALFLYSRRAPGLLMWLLMVALLGHTLGDIFLMSDEFRCFIFGMAAFMFGHIFYIVILQHLLKINRKHQASQANGNSRNLPDEGPEQASYTPVPSLSLPRRIVEHGISLLIPILLAIFIPQSSIWMRFLVAAYAYVLLTVARLSGRCITFKVNGGAAALAGISLFIISDSILALHTFLGIEFALRHAVVMGTYLLAQGLLVYGLCRASTSGACSENEVRQILD